MVDGLAVGNPAGVAGEIEGARAVDTLKIAGGY